MAILNIITGPMFCGKTSELTRRLHTAKWAGKKILIIRPAKDGSGVMFKEQTTLASRTKDSDTDQFVRKVEFHAFPISERAEVEKFLSEERYDILAVDGAQFFEPWFLDFTQDLLRQEAATKFQILLAGLDMDAWRKPFGIMPQLFAMANHILKLEAVCFKCKSEHAIYSQKIETKNDELAEDASSYEARCAVCHTLPGAPENKTPEAPIMPNEIAEDQFEAPRIPPELAPG
jgi:thymidine kinase